MPNHKINTDKTELKLPMPNKFLQTKTNEEGNWKNCTLSNFAAGIWHFEIANINGPSRNLKPKGIDKIK